MKNENAPPAHKPHVLVVVVSEIGLAGTRRRVFDQLQRLEGNVDDPKEWDRLERCCDDYVEEAEKICRFYRRGKAEATEILRNRTEAT